MVNKMGCQLEGQGVYCCDSRNIMKKLAFINRREG